MASMSIADVLKYPVHRTTPALGRVNATLWALSLVLAVGDAVSPDNLGYSAM